MISITFRFRRTWTAGFLGFAALSSQMVFMRELAAVFYGNELSLGALFAVWLFWTAAGSGLLPKRFPVSAMDSGRLGSLFFGLSLAIPLTVFGIRMSRTALAAVPGEIVGFGPMLLTGLVLFAAFCLLSGYAYAAACAVLRDPVESKAESEVESEADPEPESAEGSEAKAVSRVYALEAAGAAAGGLLTSLLFFPFLPSARIICLLSFLAVFTGMIQPRHGRKNRTKQSIGYVLLVLSAAAFAFGPRIQSAADRRFWRSGSLVISENTAYGNLAAARAGGEISFFENGLRLFTCPDPQTAEESVHYALLEHPAPEKILIVGGSLGGAIGEAFKHPTVKSVHAAELDPETVRLARRIFSGEDRRSLDDPRVTFLLTDARRHIRTSDETYDAVLLNLPNPYTLQINRYYTREFFLEVRSRLKPGGVFSFSLPSSENSIGRELADFLGSVSATLSSVFPDNVLLPGDNCRFIASMDGRNLTSDPAVLAERVRSRGLSTAYVREYYLPYQFSKERRDYLSSKVEGLPSAKINRDLRPVSFWFDFILWSRHFAAPFMARVLSRIGRMNAAAGCALLIGSGLLAWLWAGRKRSARFPARLSVLCIGISGIAVELVILLSYQTLYGVLYQDMALIVAGFMAGLGMGGALRIPEKFRAPFRLRRRLAFFHLMSGLSAAAVPGFLLLLRGTGMPPVSGLILSIFLNAAAGFAGGAAFVTANALFFSLTPRYSAPGYAGSAGKLYAIDLTGSMAGALLTTALAVPLMGIQNTLFSVSAVNLLVFFILLTSKRPSS
jgi:spermidine synthase